MLLVMDMQKGFLQKGSAGEIPMGRKLIPKLKDLIQFCRKKGVAIAYARQSHEYLIGGIYSKLFPDHFDRNGKPKMSRKSDFFGIVNELDVRPNDIILDKDSFSPFYSTNIDVILRDRGINTIIITGQATNVCVESTARDAFTRNYLSIVVSDCTATLTKKMHDASLESISLAFGYVVPSNLLKDLIK